MEGGLRVNCELGLTKRGHFNEVQGKSSLMTTGGSGRGLRRSSKGGGGTLRGGACAGGRLEW